MTTLGVHNKDPSLLPLDSRHTIQSGEINANTCQLFNVSEVFLQTNESTRNTTRQEDAHQSTSTELNRFSYFENEV